MRKKIFAGVLPVLLLCVLAAWAREKAGSANSLEIGMFVQDVTPTRLPVRVNGMFVERSATNAVDRLNARCLVLKQGSTRVAIAVVDTCMMPRDLIDRARQLASAETGIAADHMLISATHTHSGASAMGCLGSRADTQYVTELPGMIARGIVEAAKHREPARIGWAQIPVWDRTFCRRWIRRSDRLLTDPFGDATVRAHMHPGYLSPDAIGPSGPVDPELSVVGFVSPDGRPLAVLANYSQHYYGSPLLSSDYYGRFAAHLSKALSGSETNVFVAMTQGTSGDQAFMDYGRPQPVDIGYDAYAEAMAVHARKAWDGMRFQDAGPVRIKEQRLALAYRVPDSRRIEWAKKIAASLGDRLPATQPEIYALEALHLHERQRTELTIQALSIGPLAMTALPNEVYGLTGLKIKAQSPFASTFNIELANGAEGYIPPPEQHRLGGYTTWPARTAGLETGAEPKIVETALQLLESISGRKRKVPIEENGAYAKQMLRMKPAAYWRLDDWGPGPVRNAVGRHEARIVGDAAYRLPGPDGNPSADGHPSAPPKTPNPFSGSQINSALHLAGGRLESRLPAGENWTAHFWFWNGLPSDIRPVTATLLKFGEPQLQIGGTQGSAGRLVFANGPGSAVSGGTEILGQAWHSVALIRARERIQIYLDGQLEIEARAGEGMAGPVLLQWGGESDRGLEGKLDEVAFFDRALKPEEMATLQKLSDYPEIRRPSLSGIPSGVAVLPRTPEESLQSLRLAPGFTAELVAAEPLIESPVAIDWDLRGRLWVVEMIDYPLGLDGKGKAGGRIRILEDRDGDGRYETSTVFADGLNFPTGLITWKDGVIVTAAPEISFLRDTDGDGKADRKETWFSGFLECNQQLRVNGLRWGLDNWIYCASGSSTRGYGEEAKIRCLRTGTEIPLGSRDFKFNPETGELAPLSGPSQFGRNRDDWGDWFGVQNSWPLWHYVLEDRYLRRNPHLAAATAIHQLVTPSNPKIFPASVQEKRFHSFGEAGHFTSACSAIIYQDSLLFDSGMHSFTCEPFHNLVHHELLSREGVTFSARRAPSERESEFLASDDRWFRPVMARTGPDGALWVVDMYRYMIEHPEWLPENGRKELMPHYRAGERMGRIYRVHPAGKTPRAIPHLEKMPVREWVLALSNSNGWIRDKAQQALLWKHPSGIETLLQPAVASRNAFARLHAMHLLEGFRALGNRELEKLLADPEPGVRRNALQIAESRTDARVMAAACRLASDPDPSVQLQFASSAGEWNTREAGEALARLAVRAAGHPFLQTAVISSAAPHLPALAERISGAGPKVREVYAETLFRMALEKPDRDLLALLLGPVLSARTPDSMRLFAQFLHLLAERKLALGQLGADGRLGAILATVPAFFQEADRVASSDASAPPEKKCAMELLIQAPAYHDSAVQRALGWLDPGAPGSLQKIAAEILGSTGSAQVPAWLLKGWTTYGPEMQRWILAELMNREGWCSELLRQVEEGRVAASLFDAASRARLVQHRSPGIQALAKKIFGAVSPRKEAIEKFQPALLRPGNPASGGAVFTRLCVNCHRLGQEGHEVGPSLDSVASHAPEKLLTSILDPNAMIEPGFTAYECVLANGEELFGVISNENGNSLTLRSPGGGSRMLVRSEIRMLRSSNLSLMPEGFETSMTLQEMADLIALLKKGAGSDAK